MLVTSLIDFEGKQVSSSSFKFDIPSERFKGLKGSDFSLENQVAVGFNGKPCFYSPSLHSIESQIESSLNHE